MRPHQLLRRAPAIRSSLRPPRPPPSALFPYTTLFRSRSPTPNNLPCTPPLTRIVPSLINASLRSEEHTSELQSLTNLVCRLLLEKKKVALYSQPRPFLGTRRLCYKHHPR